MIILNKKRIILFVLIIFLSIIIYYVCTRSATDNSVIQTANMNWQKKIIIIDAGHGAPDYGAQSVDGVSEANINLKIALKLKEKLESNNYAVILTRETENGIYNNNAKTIREMKNTDLKNRVKIANESNADIFVSIHLNKINESQYWGWQTFFKSGNDSSKKLAENIQNGISSTIDRDNKRVALAIANKYLIDNIQIPTTIVECGFLSNGEESQLLQQEEYQNRLVEGIYNGIIEYYKEYNCI